MIAMQQSPEGLLPTVVRNKKPQFLEWRFLVYCFFVAVVMFF